MFGSLTFAHLYKFFTNCQTINHFQRIQEENKPYLLWQYIYKRNRGRQLFSHSSPLVDTIALHILRWILRTQLRTNQNKCLEVWPSPICTNFLLIARPLTIFNEYKRKISHICFGNTFTKGIEAVSFFPTVALSYLLLLCIYCVGFYAPNYAQITAHHAIIQLCLKALI